MALLCSSRLVVPLLVAGCGCPTFDEMTVSDPQGLATPEVLDGIRAAIEDMAAWTGLEGVCSRGVEVVPEGSIDFRGYDDWNGLSGGPRKHVLISSVVKTFDRAHRVTAHELCHRLDNEAGGLSLKHDDIFTGEEIDPRRYPTHADRVAEHFADACELGPEAANLHELAAEACGLPPLAPVRSFLREQVFPAYEPSNLLLEQELFPLQVATRPIRGLGVVEAQMSHQVGAGGQSLYIVLDHGWPHTSASASLPGPTFELVTIDPFSASVTRRQLLPAEGLEERRWAILSGDTGVLLLDSLNDRPRTRAWWVDDATGDLRAVPFPNLRGHPFPSGFVREGRAWVSTELPGGDIPRQLRVDLSTGRLEEHPLTDLGGEGAARDVLDVVPADWGVTASVSWYDESLEHREEVAVVLGPDGTLDQSLQLGDHLHTGRLVPLDDARVVLRWGPEAIDPDGEIEAAGWLVGELPAGTLALAEPECGPAGTLPDPYSRPAAVGGVAWLVDNDEWTGWTLTGITPAGP